MLILFVNMTGEILCLIQHRKSVFSVVDSNCYLTKTIVHLAKLCMTTLMILVMFAPNRNACTQKFMLIIMSLLEGRGRVI